MSSGRIEAILRYIRPGRPLYDLCCDHGLIGLTALLEKGSSKVYFVDQSLNALRPLQNVLAQKSAEIQARAFVIGSPAEHMV